MDIFLKNKDWFLLKGKKKLMVVGDGPPFTSGAPHLGTIYNKCLKNMFISSLILQGYKVEFKLAFDNHGSSIEKHITNVLQGEDFITKQQDNYIDIYHSLKLLYTGNRYFFTDCISYRRATIDIFKKLNNLKLIKLDNLPVKYCLKEGVTAFADQISQVEKVKTVYFLSHIEENLYALVYTTTIYTIPGRTALAYSKNISYSLYSYMNMKVIAIKNFKHKHLNYIEDFNLFEKYSIFIDADWVKNDHSGIVNIVPLYDIRDYQLAVKNKLQINNLFKNNIYDFDGIKADSIDEANEKVLDRYRDLIVQENYENITVIYNSRSKLPTVNLVSKQLFLNFNKEKTLNFVNSSYVSNQKSRLINTISSRNYWCISRQRMFGTAIPFDYLKLYDYDDRLEAFEATGLREWSSFYPVDQNSIFDCWFESSILPLYLKTDFDYVIEGHDQHTGWFNSGYIMLSLFNKQFSKNVYTHGFICTDKNVKMSKSTGTGFKFERWSYPVDLLYIIFASFSMDKDIVFNQQIIESNLIKYKKIIKILDSYKENNDYTEDKYFESHMNYLHKKVYDAVCNFKFNIGLEFYYKMFTEYSKLYENNKRSSYFFKLVIPYINIFLPNYFWEHFDKFKTFEIYNIFDIHIDIKAYLKQRISDSVCNDYYEIIQKYKNKLT